MIEESISTHLNFYPGQKLNMLSELKGQRYESKIERHAIEETNRKVRTTDVAEKNYYKEFFKALVRLMRTS